MTTANPTLLLKDLLFLVKNQTGAPRQETGAIGQETGAPETGNRAAIYSYLQLIYSREDDRSIPSLDI